jgi:aryl-alcohol dehydrogenase-like predicted oxidoreductase
MTSRRIGAGNLETSALGLGCMGLSEFYGPTDQAVARETIRCALDCGITLFDTADMYGNGANETLLGSELKSVRSRVILATKFGIVRGPGGKRLDGTPSYAAQACEASLRRLQTECIDLYYLHRVDPATPIEETVSAMARLVQQGKVRCLGLSKVDSSTLERAQAVHPIAAVQAQYSLWARGVEAGLLETCHRLNVGLVAHAPLCKGFLAGHAPPDESEVAERRKSDTRFQGEHAGTWRERADALCRLAREMGCSPAQLTLCWLLARGGDVIPIPGMRSPAQVRENVEAAHMTLTQDEMVRIEASVADSPAAYAACSLPAGKGRAC